MSQYWFEFLIEQMAEDHFGKKEMRLLRKQFAKLEDKD